MEKTPSFLNWLQSSYPLHYDEAVSQQHYWHGENPIAKLDPEEREYRKKNMFGMPRASKVGFSDKDRKMIERGAPEVEDYLNKVTNKWGIHWLLLYIEPKKGSQPSSWTDKGELEHPSWGDTGKTHWDVYEKMSGNIAARKAQAFMQENGLDPQDTIVYIKQGSRVHGLSVWQQLHNIGHAVLGACGKQQNALVKKIQDVVRDLQMTAYDSNPDSQPPSEQEITVVLSRLLNNQSLQRALTVKDDELDKGTKLVNTAFNSYQELMYDLMASFLRNGGKLPLKPRGELTGASARAGKGIDRSGDLSDLGARGEIDRKFGDASASSLAGSADNTYSGKTRDFAWKALASDAAAWQAAAEKLERIIYASFKCATWGRQGGPVHATPGYLTYDP